MDSAFKGSTPSPLNEASIFSRLTFWWMNGLFSKGYDRRLEPEDLYEVRPEDAADRLVTDLECEWQKEHSTAVFADRNVSLERVLWKSIRKSLLVIGTWGFLNETMRTVQPLLLFHLLSCFEEAVEFPRQRAFISAAGLMVASLLSALFNQMYFYTAHKAGMRLQIAITGVIYRKALRMSHHACEKASTDQIMDLLSSDAQKLDLGALLLHYLWLAPLQMFVISCLLWQQLGVSCLVGVGLLILFIPHQVCLDAAFTHALDKSTSLADERSTRMEEVLSEMRFLKMNTWEDAFLHLINRIRSREVFALRKASSLRGLKMALEFPAQVLLCFGIFMTYLFLGNRLTAAVVFSTIAFVNALQRSVAKHLPLGVQRLKETKLSIRKIQNFLELEELGLERIRKSSRRTGEVGVKATDVSASWDKRSAILAVAGVTFDVKRGDLLMVVGQSGAGKSSLLMSLLGELCVATGEVEFRGRMSYAPQKPWVFAGTVRQNILFGQQYDDDHYWAVIKACALEKDVDLMPEGDMTLVGEAALSLNETQKTKISLARAVYHKADIYLLDDPLSALDPQEGRHLFDECITGLLAKFAVILVTNQLQNLRCATEVLCLQEGCVIGRGKYTELATSGLDLRSLVSTPEEDEDRDSAIDDDSGSTGQLSVGGSGLRPTSWRDSLRRLKSLYRRSATSSVDVQLELTSKESTHVFGGCYLEPESRPRASIPCSLYSRYFCAGAHWLLVGLVMLFCLAAQGAFTVCEWWLACWSQEGVVRSPPGKWTRLTSLAHPTSNLSREDKVAIYGGLVGATVLFSLVKTFSFLGVTLNSSQVLHNRMLRAVIQTPMHFFDTNSVGRILSRFTSDVGFMDNLLPETFLECLQMSIMAVAVVVVNVVSIPWVLLGVVPLLAIFYYVRNYHLKTATEIKRLQGSARVPIASHARASLDGLAVIRTLKCQGLLTREFSSFQDSHTESHFLFIASSRWLAFRLDVLCLLFLFMASFGPLFVIERQGTGGVNPGIVALALVYALRLTGSFQLCVRESAEVESQMTSVERVVEYCELEPEGEWHVQSDLPPQWPYLGLMTGEGLSFQYHPSLPRVLRNLYFCIRPKEKVGVVGRTGAGKSSLLWAFMRLHEPNGSVRIDGIDITEIGLHDLRSKISVIPPQPALFRTTLRHNLDPLGEHSDESIRQALAEVDLLEASGGLHAVLEPGLYSLGQRRLMCLARALLRRNRILILDEGSELIDQRSDTQIQEIIRRKFVDCTVVTITQRLSTIMDVDRVLVLDSGRLREVDEPHILLENKDSLFAKLVEETGRQATRKLSRVARQAHADRNRPNSHESVPDSDRSHLASYIPNSGYTDLQLLTLV